MNGFNTALRVEELGDRCLLSGFGGFGFGSFFMPSPTVQADLAQIKTDTQKLQSDLTTLGPMLQTDRQAITTAVQAAIQNDASVQTAMTTLQTDRTAAKTTLTADWQAVFAATDSTSRMAAFMQLETDAKTVAQTLQTDRTAVQTAINADAGVTTAKAQFQTDAAPIVADKAAITADWTKLIADIKAGA